MLSKSLKTTEQNQKQAVLEVEAQDEIEKAESPLDGSIHKVHREQAHQVLSGHENPTINIDEGEKWEKEIRWQFLTFNNDLLPNLVTVLNNFQQTENLKALTLCEEQGIFGTIVDKIAGIMHEVNLQPLKEFTYLFNLGSFVTGGVRVRYKLLHILLSGIYFHKTKV